MPDIEKILSAVDSNLDASLQRLFELIAIPSISTDKQYAKECRRAGQWLVDYLGTLGFEASLRDTAGHPMVVAHYKKPGAGRRKLLFYGHYDVQPVDPLNLWETEPFKPVLTTGPDGAKRISGRGAEDDKGQLMTFIDALAAQLKVTGELPADVTLLFEGEEENGSINLVPFMKANVKELQADVALVCDTGMWDRNTPAITTSVRGNMGEEVIVTCANQDLHSGMFGGPAQNPIRALAKVLAKMHDESGRVTLPGFYDGVDDISDATRKQWQSLNFSEKDFLNELGLSVPAGEKGRMLLEQIWTRPTLEFVGITGGYTGEGFKTVLPAQASTKISCRLVGRQEPQKIRDSLRKFIRDNMPPDCKLEFKAHGNTAGFQVPINGPLVTKAAAALKQEWGRETVLMGSGGYIPSGIFKELLGMDCLLIGFGLQDDRIHSPNEKYELSSYHNGTRSWVRIINALAQ
jgi:acetylornithine deacetylase/succinyl-diaminopimelate desuccinylase-like protein